MGNDKIEGETRLTNIRSLGDAAEDDGDGDGGGDGALIGTNW